MTVIEDAARDLFATRGVKQAAHAVLREYRQENGRCDWWDDNEHAPCYVTNAAFEDWCKVCQGAQPLWEVRRAASIKATTAMNRLRRLCVPTSDSSQEGD